LGAWNFADQFQISQKLYGREAEIAELISAFERVSSSLGKEPAIAHGYGVILSN